MLAGDAPWFGYLPVEGDVPLALNPLLDLDALAARFAADRRVQIADVLAPETATRLQAALAREVPWGLAYFADRKPQYIDRETLAGLSAEQQSRLIGGIQAQAQAGAYQYVYYCYPLLDAFTSGAPTDAYIFRWLEFVNSEPMIGLVRHVTGYDDLRRADGQATLFARNQFLGLHTDSHVAEGWRVAYVMNLALNWRPDFGGYLLFYDEAGNVTQGLKPSFNCLNLLAVPQPHAVSYVSNFAPAARVALTGWFRNK